MKAFDGNPWPPLAIDSIFRKSLKQKLILKRSHAGLVLNLLKVKYPLCLFVSYLRFFQNGVVKNFNWDTPVLCFIKNLPVCPILYPLT